MKYKPSVLKWGTSDLLQVIGILYETYTGLFWQDVSKKRCKRIIPHIYTCNHTTANPSEIESKIYLVTVLINEMVIFTI